jgi:hypothetical protein
MGVQFSLSAITPGVKQITLAAKPGYLPLLLDLNITVLESAW